MSTPDTRQCKVRCHAEASEQKLRARKPSLQNALWDLPSKMVTEQEFSPGPRFFVPLLTMCYNVGPRVHALSIC